MEQIIEHDMELDHADTTVQILEKALTVFKKVFVTVSLNSIVRVSFIRFISFPVITGYI